MGDNGDGVEHKNYASYDYKDDPARQIWGDPWRTPTAADFQELINNTTHYTTELSDVYGILFINDSREILFFPAAGRRESSNLYGTGYSGNYWCSELEDNTYACYALKTYFEEIMGIYVSDDLRYSGLSVRPVAK